ncbi:MAG: DUF4159 domain-containing protein [Longimicrobiales bacterium]|nr:DUF4159 domain-containing protein [Longimicrobiales bacterium]
MRGTLLLAVLAVVSLYGTAPGAGPPAGPAPQGVSADGAQASSSRTETVPHSFYFTRAAYTSGMSSGWRRGRAWSTDYPKADRQFLVVLRRVTNLDAPGRENAVRLDDPELRRYPFLYAVEVGHMELTDAEVEGLRDYLLAGGFLVVDDFWGSREWAAFERNIRKVLPGRPIVELPRDHPVFRAYYDIDEIVQVPAVSNIRWGRTWERDGYVPHVRGIFGEDGRLLVAINWNTDLGDAWEWADIPEYPLEYSTFAYQMGVNLIVYAMSH